jgi:alanine racemase
LVNPSFNSGELVFDTRKMVDGSRCVFIAINSSTRNGHQFIAQAYSKGCRMFVVSEPNLVPLDANFILCENTIDWLQHFASETRKSFNFPLLAITGSNGKTVIKEWLLELINPKEILGYSPKSYNSQLGVAMSLLTADKASEIGLFEAGISLPGEMERLQKMLSPEMGIISNIGSSHLENFKDQKALLIEKLKLFKNSQLLICSEAFYQRFGQLISTQLPHCKTFTWGEKTGDIIINFSEGRASFGITHITFNTPTLSKPWLENLGHCIAFGLLNNLCDSYFCKQIEHLKSIENRLAMHNTFGTNFVLNDAYSLDLNSLSESLTYFDFQAKSEKKLLLLTDFDSADVTIHKRALNLVKKHPFDKILLLGQGWKDEKKEIPVNAEIINTKPEANAICSKYIASHSMLFKGSRKWQIETVVDSLLKLCNRSYLEINLAAIKRNAQKLKQSLGSETKLLAMLKAEAYGSGLQRIGKTLQNAGADYLGVAFTQEAIALREAGVRLPILVIHPFPEDVELALRYNLELSAYSTELIQTWHTHLSKEDKTLNIHLEIETGMYRQGLSISELKSLSQKLMQHFNIKGTFSHLAEGNKKESQRTQQQIEAFDIGLSILASKGWNTGITHLLNTDGINNELTSKYAMVRSGIGLFGLFNSGEFALKLSSKISKISYAKAGKFLGYGNGHKTTEDTNLALVPLGYADGLPYTINEAVFRVKINGKEYPLAASICMDMMMVDLGKNPANVGDTVDIIYNKASLEKICKAANTIPYEILSRFSQRIGRIFIDE